MHILDPIHAKLYTQGKMNKGGKIMEDKNEVMPREAVKFLKSIVLYGLVTWAVMENPWMKQHGVLSFFALMFTTAVFVIYGWRLRVGFRRRNGDERK